MRKGKRVAFFVTGNVHKFHEARDVLSGYGVATAMLNIDAVEVQDDDLKNIASISVKDAARRSGLPVFVEDAGLFIDALNGFPGPYSSYVYRTVGTKGILRLMKDVGLRDAHFQSVVAFCNPGKVTKLFCFDGEVSGRIAYEERGSQGFGFDPVFEPAAELGKTFGEVTREEKNRYSHRARALRKFAEWYSMHVR